LAINPSVVNLFAFLNRYVLLMKKIKNPFFSCALAACFGIMALSHSAQAETTDPIQNASNDWIFGADLYVWGAGVGGETSRGNEIDISFSDIVNNLDLGFMGTGHVYHDRWHASLDLLYISLSANNGKEITLPQGANLSGYANVDQNLWVVTPAVGYVAIKTPHFELEPFAGARYTQLDTTLDIRVNNFSRSFSNSDGILDGIVGARGNVLLNQQWYLPYYADIGAGDSDITWQAMAGVGYRITEKFDLCVGYRYLEWQFDDNPLIKDLNFSGPIAGARLRF
jgi:opacity protein-like surface antigen